MISRGIWTKQDKKLPGIWVKFANKQSTDIPTDRPPIEPTYYILLKDCTGALLKTADNYYLAVKEK